MSRTEKLTGKAAVTGSNNIFLSQEGWPDKWHPTFLIDARLAAEAYSPSMNLLSSVSVSTYLSLLNLWLISRQNP
jgi:hypothetical protein